jgi:hypothetical protein
MDGGSSVFRGLATDLDSYLTGMAKQHVEPGLVIVDPLSNVLEGDENDALAFRDLFATARQLAERYDVSVTLSHHTRKSAVGQTRTRSSTPPLAEMVRGSNAIVAGARLVLALVPTGSETTAGGIAPGSGQTANLVVAKSNDGPAGEVIRLKMDPNTGLWDLDDTPAVPVSFTVDSTRQSGQLTRRDQVLRVLAIAPVDGSGTGRRAALDVFRGEPNPGAALRSALRDLRVKSLIDSEDHVTDLGRVRLERIK